MTDTTLSPTSVRSERTWGRTALRFGLFVLLGLFAAFRPELFIGGQVGHAAIEALPVEPAGGQGKKDQGEAGDQAPLQDGLAAQQPGKPGATLAGVIGRGA